MATRKFFSIDKLTKIVSSLKKRNKKIIFTNGCFDIIHAGHISYLTEAKKLGDVLIIALNSDTSVKSNKGNKRPINTLKDRIKVISALECCDYVCSFNESTPISLIKKIAPDILVKGGDWKNKVIVGSDFVKSHGGRIATIPFIKGHSTSKLLEKISCL
jgi:rfaE bifunctional protein nucleotidyltransferase chain/domain